MKVKKHSATNIRKAMEIFEQYDAEIVLETDVFGTSYIVVYNVSYTDLKEGEMYMLSKLGWFLSNDSNVCRFALE